MKSLNIYNTYSTNQPEQVFEYLMNNLKSSNRLWDYFVDWETVIKNTQSIEIPLNTLNFLIGKKDFDQEFIKLIMHQPDLVAVLPYLTVRDGGNNHRLSVLVDFKNRKLHYKDFDFSKKIITEEDARDYLEFVTKTGVKNLFVNKQIKNLVDYILGVEAGLNSNARKNRGGKSMETITKAFVEDLCDRKNYKFICEANAKKIFDTYKINVPVDKSSRRYDFVVYTGNEIYLIETNFYGGGGSKLKSTAGEYRNLFDTLDGKFKFIWITDGEGWKTAKHPLYESFIHNDFVFTLKLLEDGILDEVIQ